MRRPMGTRVLALLLLAVCAFGGALGRAPHAAAAGGTVQAFFSSDNRQYKLSAQPTLTFTAPASTTGTLITIDPSTSYQTMLGIGGSFDHLTIHHLRRMSAATRQTVLKNLVDPTSGIGYNWLRICFGTPDATLEPYYSYADVKGPDSDPLANFSIQKDIDNDNIAIIKEVLSYNPNIKILASQWSPPAWMKSSNSLSGGSFGSGWLQTLAQYFRRAIQAYSAQGIPIYAMTMQNEPGVSVNYPSMLLDEFQEAQLLLELKSQFSTAGIATKVWIYDQSYPSTQYYVDPMLDRTGYPFVKPSVDGIAFHDYEGDVGEMTRVHTKYPDKEIHMTEKSAGLDVSTSVSMVTVFRNWAQSWADWVTVGDGSGQNNGPYLLGGLINNTPTDANAIDYTSGYYHMGQFAKFIKRGAVRIGSDAGTAATVRTVAFRNPDGQRVLVVTNETTSDQPFSVVAPDAGQFATTLPARSTGTYLWSGAVGGGSSQPSAKIEAEQYTSQVGTQTETTSDVGGGLDVGYTDAGDYLRYASVDFGSGVTQATARFATASTATGNTLEFHLDSTGGPLIGTLALAGTGGWQNWTSQTTAISAASGVHDLYLVFRGGTSIGNLNWFGFSGGSTTLDRTGWTASASSSPSDPCCNGDTPAKAIDGNAATRWSSGQSQTNGQYFQIDMGAAHSFSKLVLDAGTSSGDYPHGYAVYVSNDGVAFGSAIASGTGSSQLLTVNFATQTARYLKIVQTGSAGNWWSIHELTLST